MALFKVRVTGVASRRMYGRRERNRVGEEYYGFDVMELCREGNEPLVDLPSGNRCVFQNHRLEENQNYLMSPPLTPPLYACWQHLNQIFTLEQLREKYNKRHYIQVYFSLDTE